MWEAFTPAVVETVDLAASEARSLGHHSIGGEHLLLALFGVGGGASIVLEAFRLDEDELRSQLPRGDWTAGPAPWLSGDAAAALARALVAAAARGRSAADSEHLLLGLREGGRAAALLELHGVEAEALVAAVAALADTDVEGLRRGIPTIPPLGEAPEPPGDEDPFPLVDGFTREAAGAIQAARQEAEDCGHAAVHPEHLAFGVRLAAPDLVDEACGPLARVGRGFLHELDLPMRALDGEEGAPPPPLTSRAVDALEAAVAEAGSVGAAAVGADHLLLGLLARSPDACARVLFDPEVVAGRLRARRER
jgi:ATP-dependent Clp protease ATP-binding subunit ClpA